VIDEKICRSSSLPFMIRIGGIAPAIREGAQQHNIKEVKSRDGIIVALGNAGGADLAGSADHFIRLPSLLKLLK
jgi:hypothetical protein